MFKYVCKDILEDEIVHIHHHQDSTIKAGHWGSAPYGLILLDNFQFWRPENVATFSQPLLCSNSPLCFSYLAVLICWIHKIIHDKFLVLKICHNNLIDCTWTSNVKLNLEERDCLYYIIYTSMWHSTCLGQICTSLCNLVTFFRPSLSLVASLASNTNNVTLVIYDLIWF